MDIDANGVWTNENDPGTITIALRLATETPSLSLTIPARVPDLSGDERRDKVFFSDVEPSDRLIPDESTGQRGRLRHPRPHGPARRSWPARPSRPCPSPHSQPLRPARAAVGCRGFRAGCWACSRGWGSSARSATSASCPPGRASSATDKPLLAIAKKATLSITVTERGNLESYVTVDGICEVNGSQNKIIYLVPEGTKVKKGDVVCKFDGSEIEKNIAQQEIKVKQAVARIETTQQEMEIQRNKGESDIIAAKVELTLAELDLEKYQKGDYPAENTKAEGEMRLKKKDVEAERPSSSSTRRS